jgi:prepilin-type N-terminal cleavage/methylation domain-containing protein
MKKPAFTLLELLIVVALIGVITAIGVPFFDGIITNAKKVTAQNSLRAISLVEANYFAENGTYLTANVDKTENINTKLFGKKTLDEDGDYTYSITQTPAGYLAKAIPKPLASKKLQTYCVDHNEAPPRTDNC